MENDVEFVKSLLCCLNENYNLCNYQLQSAHNTIETLGIFSNSNKVWNKRSEHNMAGHMLYIHLH
jgi:hypothetical protein